jgi:Zinc finger, C3HC4 type (RING finger)
MNCAEIICFIICLPFLIAFSPLIGAYYLIRWLCCGYQCNCDSDSDSDVEEPSTTIEQRRNRQQEMTVVSSQEAIFTISRGHTATSRVADVPRSRDPPRPVALQSNSATELAVRVTASRNQDNSRVAAPQPNLFARLQQLEQEAEQERQAKFLASLLHLRMLLDARRQMEQEVDSSDSDDDHRFVIDLSSGRAPSRNEPPAQTMDPRAALILKLIAFRAMMDAAMDDSSSSDSDSSSESIAQLMMLHTLMRLREALGNNEDSSDNSAKIQELPPDDGDFSEMPALSPECSICLDRPKSKAMIPCGHCFCDQCSRRIESTCAICRANIEQKISLHFNV